ncbi:MAG: class I SAM-dependent methyltransferase [Vicingaceae bacterium]
MKTYTNCPICEGKEFDKSLSCVDYTVSQKKFDITQCKSCGFQFTNPIPLETEIGKYYESEEYISHSNTSKGLVNKLYQTVRNITLQQKIQLIKRLVEGKKLLDIGCGTGEFLKVCKDNGYDVKGIEPSESAKKFAVENYKLDVYSEEKIKEFSPNSFDLITMWHVLEHVYHLKARVEEAQKLIVKNGVLIVAVPNHNSYDAEYYKEHWAAYDVPRHLYHFSPTDIKNLFEPNGFELEDVLPMKFDSYYVSMLSEKYKTGKANLLKAFQVGLKSNQKASKAKSPKYSSQIYILRKN